MKFNGALIKEQGVTFAIVLIKKSTFSNRSQSAQAMQFFTRYFNVPIVLATKDSTGIIRYQGRRDLVNFLSKLHPSQIPWKTYYI